MSQIEHLTTEAAVQTYESTREIFDALLKEVRELSKKKPELVLTAGKVNIINRVLRELVKILEPEPEGQYLDLLDQSLPQTSDALFVMVQFEQALEAFRMRYDSEDGWMTPELIAELEAEGIDDEDDDDDEDEDDDDAEDDDDEDEDDDDDDNWEDDEDEDWEDDD